MTTEPTAWWKTLYNHNPFYVISTVLMLVSVRAAYGEMPIGDINCWAVMAVLAGYTTLLAVIGVCVIRFGKIWEDARSILLLLLLLFLGISVSMDDLFVRLDSPKEGALLAAGGALFAFLITEGVLLFARVKLKILYRVPYYLFLLLFFFTPWWFSPEIHPRDGRSLEWLLLLFPLVAAGIILTLLPAVWAGPRYVKQNGTPWKWPLYPWSMFVILIVATMMRSYALCFTFAPAGPIWHDLSSGGLGIVFSTIWGTWFLVPMFFAILVLLLEAGIVVHSRSQQNLAMWLAPLLLVSALPIGSSHIFLKFWNQTINTIGSPVWLTCFLLLAFYIWAYLRKVQGASVGVTFSILLFTRIGPATDGFTNLLPIQPVPVLLLSTIVLVQAIKIKSSFHYTIAACLFAGAAFIFLPDTQLAEWAMPVTLAALWFLLMVIGLVYHDEWALFLRAVTVFQMLLAGLYILLSPQASQFLFVYRLLAILLLASFCLAAAFFARSKWYLRGFYGCSFLLAYGSLMIGFHEASSYFGATAITAFSWSVGTLLSGILISAHKANWLSTKFMPEKWT